MEAERARAHHELRASTVRLRDMREASCSRWQGSLDCELAALNTLEIALLDMEDRMRLRKRSASEAAAPHYSKVLEAIDELRGRVDDLADDIADIKK
jgi:hypothetical protein